MPWLDDGDVRRFGAIGNGTADDRDKVSDADDYVAATDHVSPLFFPKGTYKIGSNLTIVSPIHFAPGAKLKPSNGVTVTINGKISAVQSQIFDVSLGGEFAFAGGVFADGIVVPQWWGAVGDGTTNDSTAIELARQAAALAGTASVAGTLLFPPGSYVTDEVKVDHDRMQCIGMFRPILIARANNQTLINIASSYCKVSGFELRAGGHSGVVGIRLAPSDEETQQGPVRTDFNTVSDIYTDTLSEGVTLAAGGDAAGSCFYNEFRNIHCYKTLRGVWLRSPVGLAETGPNRNQFYSVRVGQSTEIAGVNTGFQIDAGETNSFFGCSCEGVQYGTSPSTNPTALVINSVDPVTEAECSHNRFYGFRCEECTRDTDIDNAKTEFYGASIDVSKCYGTAPIGGVAIGADTSQFPITMPTYNERGDFTPTISSGYTSPGYSSNTGKFWRTGQLVYFRLEIVVNSGTRNSNNLIIDGLPYTSEATFRHGGYWSYASGVVGSGNPLPNPRIVSNATLINFYTTNGAIVNGTDLNTATPVFEICGLYRKA